MHVRIATTALAAALAAGCSGGHGSAARPQWAVHRGVFRARVVTTLRHPSRGVTPGPAQRIWVNTATGAFRVSVVDSHPRYRLISVSDGRTATQLWGSKERPQLTAYHGSRRFLASQVGGDPLRIVQAFLTGTAPPQGVRVRVVSGGPPAVLVATTAPARLRITIASAPHAGPATFRTARGHAEQTVRELRPGMRPSQAVSAYWLGPEWDGHAARSSSAASGSSSYYIVGYPHLSVEVSAVLPGISGDQPVTLMNGTHATLQVAGVHPDGSVSFGGTNGAGAFFAFQSASTGGKQGGTMAFVFLPHAMITLSGSAVTPRTATLIARALRPL